MNGLIAILLKLVKDKFTGSIEITFNQGGIQGIKRITRETI
ncbi:unnamed protein product [marine sediment metagenome]|uniref:Uncharacterized protein n=1 Tax=marine sediment metagenome TaxID=412755 RepID=X1A2N2_9ZZZZ